MGGSTAVAVEHQRRGGGLVLWGKYQIEPFQHRALVPQCLFPTTLSRRHRPFLVRGGTGGSYVSERRNSRRQLLKAKLRVRAWKSGWNEQRAESENLSERGLFFATGAPLVVGSAVEVLLKMPEEISGRPTTEWRCTGHGVRLEPVDTPRGKLGVGIQFDCYEILRSEAALPS